MSATSQEKQEDLPPPPLSRYEEDSEAEDCVAGVIETVIEGVNREISAKSVQLIENGLASEVAMYKLQQVVHSATVMHDGDIFPDQILELLVPDEEPVPAPVDNWARGAVSSRVVKPTESRFTDQNGLSDGTRTPSVSSFRSSSTRSRSTTHSRGVSSRGAPRQLSSAQGEGTDSAPRIIELDDESSSYFGDNGANMNGTGQMYDMLQKQKNRLKQLTHTDDTVKDEFQLMQEEVDRAKEDLKGKNYIFDQNGQIVVIQPLKSDQLPPFSFNPSLNVSNTDSTHNDESKKKNQIAQQQKKKKKLRVAGSRGVDDNGDRAMFIPTTSLATTIAGNSHEMHLNNGVAIHTNKISKEGPPIADDPRKPTRKEYFNRKATAAMTTSLDASWDEGDNNASREDSFHSNGFDLNDSSVGMAEKSSTFTGGSRFKDINPLEGGRLKLAASSSTAGGGAPDSYRSSQSASSRRTSEDGGKRGKQQPAVEPTKPTQQQQTTVNLLHGGTHMQGPRDRLPSQILNTRADKKKYVIPTKNIAGADDLDAQSYNSFSSKKSNGTIKKEKLARDLF